MAAYLVVIRIGGGTFPFFFSSRRRHTRFDCDWSSDVCSSDLGEEGAVNGGMQGLHPTVHHFGKSGDLADVEWFESLGAQRLRRSTSRDELPSEREIGRASCRERV